MLSLSNVEINLYNSQLCRSACGAVLRAACFSGVASMSCDVCMHCGGLASGRPKERRWISMDGCKRSKRMLKVSEACCGFVLASCVHVSLLELTDSEDFLFAGAFCHALNCPVDGLKLTSTLSLTQLAEFA